MLKGHRRHKRIGRGIGSGHGKTATRGHKGQKSRSGVSFRPHFEGGQMPLARRLPKRGFSRARFRRPHQIINLGDLTGRTLPAVVNPEWLVEQGLIDSARIPVKVLADGEWKSKSTVRAHAFSQQAQSRITTAGGKVEIIHA